MGRRELTSDDVRRLVFDALLLIGEVQKETGLPISPTLAATRRRLRRGTFMVGTHGPRRGPYAMEYGAFEPPSTIILDSRIPFCDRPLELPELPASVARYTAAHEAIHADDHTGGDLLLLKTQRHILGEHGDKLERGMRVVRMGGGCDSIGGREELARFWATQYVDMVTHYRTYVVLRHRRLPRLEDIWAGLGYDPFPPTLLTQIEGRRGVGAVFDSFTRRAGEYCIIDALMESESIGERNACSYMV